MPVVATATAYLLSDFQVWNGSAWVGTSAYNSMTNTATATMWRLRPDFDPAQAMTATFTDDDAYANDYSYGFDTDAHPDTGVWQSYTVNTSTGAQVTAGAISFDTAGVDLHTAMDTTNGGNPTGLQFNTSELDIYSLAYPSNGTFTNVFVTTRPLRPGMVYGTGPLGTLPSMATELDGTTGGNNYGSDQTVGNVGWANFVCFVDGTMIETDTGQKPVEMIAQGDLVRTKDNGFKPVLWVGKKTVILSEMSDPLKLSPIRIRAGSLGTNIPETDLCVSPQHRVLVNSKIAKRICGADEVLIAAKKLVGIDGISIDADRTKVTYVHLLFDQHEIIYSNGAETESLYTGPEALKAVDEKARTEILKLFPELVDVNYRATAARIIPSGKLAKELKERHLMKDRPLCIPHLS